MNPTLKVCQLQPISLCQTKEVESALKTYMACVDQYEIKPFVYKKFITRIKRIHKSNCRLEIKLVHLF